jgi:hypothetical protein
MASKDIHGTVGIVRTTTRGGFEDLIRILPEGTGVIHTGFGRLAAEMP